MQEYTSSGMCGGPLGFYRDPRPDGTPPPQGSTEWHLVNSESMWRCVHCQWMGKGSQLELRPGLPADFPDWAFCDPNWIQTHCPKCGESDGLRSPLVTVEAALEGEDMRLNDPLDLEEDTFEVSPSAPLMAVTARLNLLAARPECNLATCEGCTSNLGENRPGVIMCSAYGLHDDSGCRMKSVWVRHLLGG
jgi:hypothetical protein